MVHRCVVLAVSRLGLGCWVQPALETASQRCQKGPGYTDLEERSGKEVQWYLGF